MRLIHISDYDYDSMQLAKPIFDSKKRVLLASGRHVHPKYIERLKLMNITHMFVEDNISRGINLDEMIDMPTWMDAIDLVQDTFEKVEKNEKIDVIAIQQLAGKLIVEVQKRPLLVLVPVSTIPRNLYPYAHAVNVALLSVQVGKRLFLNQLQLRDLVIGCLLHDIGKIKADEDEGHPKEGFEIIRKIREFNIVSAHVAYQHHESLNGTGYPRKLTGQDFHKFAQICGIANQYENMVTKKQIPPHEAMERLMTMSDTNYETSIVHAFVQGIPSYPPGTKIELNTNERGIVIRLESQLQRPIVRTLPDEKIINLEDHPTIIINGLA
ncbi:HD-GYP domain-containing protein [Calidifontibacillus oryziterrae]|uniref:HD-GYP domain-containing protein n=1 Tax=Calidifontibacillus oryziterrae TaxID=1191699 RepID=UPI00030336C7|nr:HD domain-containing phosphohydrolase [Calidifontibacillus oryziterrae]